jgi:hypothetical protein
MLIHPALALALAAGMSKTPQKPRPGTPRA